MEWKTIHLQTRLYLISAIVLLIGLSSSSWIYLANRKDPETVLGYEISVEMPIWSTREFQEVCA